MKKIYTIEEIKEIVAPIAAKYGIESIYLFGSYARGEATINSDIDLRVDRGKAKVFDYIDFKNEIEQNLEKIVDLLSTKMLTQKFLDTIRDEEIQIYESR